jgi:hypothetical protein
MTDAVASASPKQAAKRKSEITRAPWDQQPGENDLWYARFLRFIALGPGRSVSLVATGRRNAYPVPAHWPIQAKQNSWRDRAVAFDEAVVVALRARSTIEDQVELLEIFTNRLMALASTAPNGEAELLEAALKAGGYQLPPSDDEEANDFDSLATQ